MQQSISKLCADSLRALAKEKYGINLKPTHAHELVAVYLGYRSKNALLAEEKHPISDLAKAEVVVMIPDEVIDQRRQQLDGLSTELPDSYTLGEAVYGPLFSDEWWGSNYPPFRGFEKLAKTLVENNDTYQHVFRFYRDVPMHHFVSVENEEDFVLLDVLHSHETSTGEMIGVGKTTIKLPRVAGRIGFGTPKLSVEQWTAGAQRPFKAVEVQS